MGTNELRAQLRQLGSTAQYADLIAKRVANLKIGVERAEVKLAEERAKQPLTEEAYMASSMGEYVRKYPEHYNYTSYVVQFNGNKWAINEAQKNLDQHTKWLKTLQKAVK